jgi:RES domain
MQCGGRSNLRPLKARPWRVVEAQHVIATRKLVDSAAEQEELERIIEEQKPKRPSAAALGGLHFLLFTPFRHPPLRNGSRFGTRAQGGIWYGSDTQSTAFAEVAYYRLVFLDGSEAALAPLSLTLSAFQAHVGTDSGIDLTVGPFVAFKARISSPSDYAEAQALGLEMRTAAVSVFRFHSARDAKGTNVGLFVPAFLKNEPDTPETWFCTVSLEAVELTPANVPGRQVHVFGRAQFEVAGRLPSPAT